MNTTVYRVEHFRSHDGPFRDGRIMVWSCPNRPLPGEDGIRMAALRRVWKERPHFGCRSLEELGGWFTPSDLHELHSARFRVAVFFVPQRQVTFGCRQVLFRRDTLDPVHYLELSILLPYTFQPTPERREQVVSVKAETKPARQITQEYVPTKVVNDWYLWIAEQYCRGLRKAIFRNPNGELNEHTTATTSATA